MSSNTYNRIKDFPKYKYQSIEQKLLIDEFCECLVVIILFGSIGK